MAEAGLTSLPTEVIHHISQYLSVQDVLSCSLTCHYLWTALNDNFVWKHFLLRGISRLETQEKQISPKFYFDEGISHLCENRQHYIRKTQLVNNWRGEHYVHYTKSVDYSFTSALFNKTKGIGNTIYNDKYIFIGRYINDSESNGIEVWDISNVPVIHCFFKIDDVNYESFRIVGFYLVVIECIRVCVYRITLPEKTFPLVHSFLITQNNAVFNARVEHRDHNFGCVSWYHSVVGKFLMSNKCEENALHVWDIYEASKVGCFIPPEYGFFITLHSFNGDTCLFQLISQHYSAPNYLVTFNLKNKQFSQNTFSYESWVTNIINFSPYIIIFKKAKDPSIEESCDIVCTLYHFNTCLELCQRQFIDEGCNSHLLCSPLVVNGTFVIIYEHCLHTINALTLETVDCFKCDNISCITKYISLFKSVIVVGSTRNNMLEMWDVSRKCLLFKDLSMYRSHLYIDSLFTKIVSIEYRNITVVHLW